MAKEHAVFKIKYDEDYLTKADEQRDHRRFQVSAHSTRLQSKIKYTVTDLFCKKNIYFFNECLFLFLVLSINQKIEILQYYQKSNHKKKFHIGKFFLEDSMIYKNSKKKLKYIQISYIFDKYCRKTLVFISDFQSIKL